MNFQVNLNGQKKWLLNYQIHIFYYLVLQTWYDWSPLKAKCSPLSMQWTCHYLGLFILLWFVNTYICCCIWGLNTQCLCPSQSLGTRVFMPAMSVMLVSTSVITDTMLLSVCQQCWETALALLLPPHPLCAEMLFISLGHAETKDGGDAWQHKSTVI